MVQVLRSNRPAVSAPISGELVKAVIVNTTTGVSHAVMYNPEEIKLEQGNDFAEIAIPGLNATPIQYVRGKARTLMMELFFDSYETGEDVRTYTTPIVALLDKQPQTQAPPVLLFSLGRLQLRCVLADASQRYTMFLRDGTPVRSTMSVRLREYIDVSVETRSGLFFGSPTLSAAASGVIDAARAVNAAGTAVHVVGRGDTLSGIAGTYLGDPSRWRLIADTNRILDPLSLQVGTPLVIPDPRGRRS